MTVEEKKEKTIKDLQDKIRLLEFDAGQQTYKMGLLTTSIKTTRKTMLRIRTKLKEIKKTQSYNELDKVIAMIKDTGITEDE